MTEEEEKKIRIEFLKMIISNRILFPVDEKQYNHFEREYNHFERNEEDE